MTQAPLALAQGDLEIGASTTGAMRGRGSDSPASSDRRHAAGRSKGMAPPHRTPLSGHSAAGAIVLARQHERHVLLGPPKAVPLQQLPKLLQRVLHPHIRGSTRTRVPPERPNPSQRPSASAPWPLKSDATGTPTSGWAAKSGIRRRPAPQSCFSSEKATRPSPRGLPPCGEGSKPRNRAGS